MPRFLRTTYQMYIEGNVRPMKVPVQFGKWSAAPRQVEILSIIPPDPTDINQMTSNHYFVTCRITKGQRGAGRKFRLWIPMEQAQEFGDFDKAQA